MKKELLRYSLPVDTGQGKTRLRHMADFETLNEIIYRIQNKNKVKSRNG